jgi:peroxiredoxin
MANETKPAAILGQVAFVALAALVVYSFVAVTREGEMRRRCSAPCLIQPNYMGADRKAPTFTLKDVKGQTVSFDQYKGKVVFMNFWSRTCKPCLEEMPEIADLTRILADRKDVAVVTVSIDEGPEDAMPMVRASLKEDPPFLVLFDPDNKVVKGKYGTSLFPETWFIDKHGVIRARVDGPRRWSNAAVVEFIDQLRADGYCPVDIRDGHMSGQAAKLCENIGG